MGLNISIDIEESTDDLAQEGCYLRDNVVFMPAPSVLAEPATVSNFSLDGVRPLCYMPRGEGPIELNVDFPGLDLEPLRGIPTPQMCNERCKAESMCFAWTWTSKSSLHEAPYQCFLKYYLPQTKIRSKETIGLVSGLGGCKNDVWGELYCFTVTLPGRAEQQLLKVQVEMGHGIFSCDDYSIYSSNELEIDGVETTVVDHSDSESPTGGAFYSLLNTKTFIQVWQQVAKDAKYLRYSWTVKVDPDSVFIVGRLRRFLGTDYFKSVGIAYLNNCRNGLHGAIEVLSRGAVQAFAVLGPICYGGKHKLDYHDWGESLFMDQCLGKVLQIPRLESYGLLQDGTCDASGDGQDPRVCSGNSVVFHPFKDPDAFRLCATTASRHGQETGDSDSLFSNTIQTNALLSDSEPLVGDVLSNTDHAL